MTALIKGELEKILLDYPEAEVGLSIRDRVSGLSFDHNADRSFHAASTMKIPVMFEAFRRDAGADFSLDDSIEVKNQFRSIVDGSVYSMQLEDDSDDSMYSSIGRQMTVRDLNYQMITVSSNLATNVLIDVLEAANVQRLIDSLGVKKMQVLRGVEDIEAYELGLSNSTTASDLALLLETLGNRRVVNHAADGAMIEVLADQKFNEMIPHGLPADAVVAHKTGNITRIHHDAGIVYPTGGIESDDWYALVILVEGIDDENKSSALGSRISQMVHSAIR